MELTPRKRQILLLTVQDYIDSAEPVGSRTIAKRYNIGVSSATVRNEMADLEEMGLLTQPHTSAGRIPSDKGYRMYVDSLMPSEKISRSETSLLETTLNERILEKENVVNGLAKVLASLTNYTSLVLGPFIAACTLKQVTLVPISHNTALAVVVTDNGLTASQQIVLPESITAEDLAYMSRVMTEAFVGLPTAQINPAWIRRVAQGMNHHLNRFEHALEALLTKLKRNDEHKLSLGGVINIFAQPEFKDIERVKDLILALEEQRFVYRLLTEPEGDGILVRIGQENQQEEVKDCSIITATYRVDGRPVGTIGILGPTRMTYPKVISLLNYATKRLDQMLQK